MDLLREWRRRVAGGTAIALLVPVAIVVAAMALGTGGFGGLASLGQAFEGPDIPGVEPMPARPEEAEEDDPGELLADAAASGASPRLAARRTGPAARRRAPARRRRPAPQRDGRPSATPTPGAQPQPMPTASPQPAPAPTEPPSTIRQVGDQVKQVTDPIPIAGEPAGQVVDTIVETAEQLPLPQLP